MRGKSRIVRKYYNKGKMIFTLGYSNRVDARPPLGNHEHGNMMEFVHVIKGSQIYCIDDVDYIVNKGEIFFTNPYEIHNSGMHPVEKAEYYFLIIDMELANEIGVFADAEEYSCVKELWDSEKKRVIQAGTALSGAMKQLFLCFDNQDVHFDSRIRNALSETIIALCQRCDKSLEQIYANVNKSIEFIHTHSDEPIYVSELARMDNLSLSAYHKAFVKKMGATPGEYILKSKIEKAKELLASTKMSVTDIAFQTGFSSSQYFATVFKRFCCETPTEYRKRMKDID